jgi:hypothetical protein
VTKLIRIAASVKSHIVVKREKRAGDLIYVKTKIFAICGRR